MTPPARQLYRMTDVDQLVSNLRLEPHPEGGFFRETYRAKGQIHGPSLPKGIDTPCNYSTAIYYLLRSGDFSRFHRLKCDEIFHFYAGGTLLLYEIFPDGSLSTTKIGNNFVAKETPQHVIQAGNWFAAEPAPNSQYSLIGCTVAPGFDFAHFELAEAEKLAKEFPLHQELISRLA